MGVASARVGVGKIGVGLGIGMTCRTAVGGAEAAGPGLAIHSARAVMPDNTSPKKNVPSITLGVIRAIKKSRMRISSAFYTGSKKNTSARMAYTASSSIPSSQFDSPSAETSAAIITPAIRAISSNS